MENLYTSPPRLPLIAPSILSADFAFMHRDCDEVFRGGADALHLDVMDGHFVPNLTMGPDLCRCLRVAFPDAFLDVHLMVMEPERFVDPFVRAGASHLTFHAEVMDDAGVKRLARRIHDAGLTAGLAINPPTPPDRAVALVSHLDLVLVMSVNPGFSGQSFHADVLAKTRAISRVLSPSQRLQMDGGISPENARQVREAGCDVLVAATAVFGAPLGKRPAAVEALRK